MGTMRQLARLLVGALFASAIVGCASKSTHGFVADNADAGALTEGDPNTKDPATTVKPTPTTPADAGRAKDGGRVTAKPDSGGAASNCPDDLDVDVSLSTLGKVQTEALILSTGDQLPPFNSVSACPIQSDLSTEGDRPWDALVVQNNTGSAATLSAWAVCDSKGDAFLAFYRGSTIPSSESARRSCAVGTILSNGFSSTLGGDANVSPDANGSKFCPSLMAANNVGLHLAACEKAVVFIQPYRELTSSTGTPPTSLKFRLN